MRTVLLGLILYSFNSFAEITPLCEGSHFKTFSSEAQKVAPLYAKRFSIYQSPSWSLLKLKGVSGEQYFWFQDEAQISKEKVISSPCEQVPRIPSSGVSLAVLSSSHIAYLNELNQLDSLRAVANKRHIYNSHIRKKINNKEVLTLGYPPSVESFLFSESDFMTASIVTDRELELGGSARLNQQVIEIEEFRESHPLGRAEWIKVFGALTGSFNKSLETFEKIKKSFKKSKKRFIENERAPVFITGHIENGRWVASNPQSDFVEFLEMIGFKYYFTDNHKKRDNKLPPLSFSIEDMLQIETEIDLWIPLTAHQSLNTLLMESRHYQHLSVLKNIQVWNPVKKVLTDGANDYWESSGVRPDILLEDFEKMLKQLSSKKTFSDELTWFLRLE